MKAKANDIIQPFRFRPQRSRISALLAKWAICVACILAILGFVYLLRAPLLAGFAEAWIVRQDVEKADAIMLLGGGIETRAFEAARLYHEGYAPRVIVADVELQPSDLFGVTASQTELMEQVLLKYGVPKAAIGTVGKHVSSTHDEALALRDWVQAGGARKVIVPTEVFHTRRVSWVFRKALKGTGAEIRVRALDPLKYNSHNWWQREDGLIDFQREIVKFAYYLIRY